MSELVRDTIAGVRWLIRPEHRERLLGPDGLRLPEWLAAGYARVVKHGPHRTVYRVELPDLHVHIKHYRLMDVRAWLRELVRPAKARMEYERALAVAASRVPTVVPLAIGEQMSLTGPADSFLVTHSLEGTEPLNLFLDRTLPALPAARQTILRQRLADELAALVARMHDAGIVHHDLHPGNLLVRLGEADRLQLFLIDLHAAQLGRPLSWRAGRDNLILLNRWFTLRAGRTDRLRFWRAYCVRRRAGERDLLTLPGNRGSLPLDLERRTWASNLAFWRGRDQRCLVSNRYYRRVRSGDAAGFAVTDLDQETVAALVAHPDAPFARPGVTLLKDSRSSTVAELEMNVGGVPRRVIYKRFRITTWYDPWAALLRRSGAMRSWMFGHGLRERCLPTPRPLAVFHRRRHGLCHEGYLLTEMLPDAQDLHAFLASLRSLPDAERRQLMHRRIDQVARLVRELHRRQLAHRDLKAANVLLSPRSDEDAEAQVWLIDLVGVVRHRQLRHGRRVQNLARLHASFYQNAALTRTDKLRFLRVYLQWGLFGRAGWKRWWREVEAATERKAARNRRNGRVLV